MPAFLILTFFFIIFNYITAQSTRPNIIFILADDLGWNDVGFHGLNAIPTPNIDALAYSGVILNNYYVTPICTPSRSALMTGKHPIHTGMQHTVLFGAEARGLPLGEKLLPEYLKELGYTNLIVGKWHLGSYKKEYTPTFRGFDSHLGYWTGHQDYFDHTACEQGQWGLDMRRNLEVAFDLHGQYSTEVFTKEAEKLILTHNTSSPLFLYVAHAAVHSGNPYNPLPAPEEDVNKFRYISNFRRQRFAAMLTHLDNSVGRIVKALKNRKMLDNSIIIFSTDNGGPAANFNLNAASNYPLRGVKNTIWEGGVRGSAFIWSPLIKAPSRIAIQRMHISDWLPTLINAAGGDSNKVKNIDGIDVWEAISRNLESNRTEILHNIDDIYGYYGITVGPWKLMNGTTYNNTWDGWYGPSDRYHDYNVSLVENSLAGLALKELNMNTNATQIRRLRDEAEIKCPIKLNTRNSECNPLKGACLFNILHDPCETRNVAEIYPHIVENLYKRVQEINATALPPGNLPLDPRGNPKYWHYVWTNFGDLDDTCIYQQI